jgi:hypothetical protein
MQGKLYTDTQHTMHKNEKGRNSQFSKMSPSFIIGVSFLYLNNNPTH